MVRRSTLVVAVAATALLVSACGSSSGAGGTTSATGDIKVGAWFPLTGPISASGIPMAAGADAYFKQLNAAGGINGHKITYIFKDNAYDPQQTIQVARELIGQDKVVAIVATNGTAATAAAFPYVLNQAKVPIINTYGGAATWYQPPKPLVFGYQALYEEQAAGLGAWAVQDGAKKIVVVADDPAAFQNVAKNVAPGAQSAGAGASVSQVTVKLNTTDYAPIVAQVKAKSPDAVVLIVPYPEAAAYLKQAKLQGVTAKAYGYAPDGDPGLIKLAGDAAEGFHTMALTKLPSDTSPVMQKYRDALSQYEPGQTPNFYSAAGYAAAMVFAQVVKSIKGAVTPASIAAAFANAGTVDTGILPTLTYSTTQHLGTSQVQRMTVSGGAFTAVGDFYSPPPLG